MKKILYILMLSIIFTACETDVKNWVETDDGAAITSFVYQPDSPLGIIKEDYANLDYRYDLNVITQMDGWQSVKVNISFVDVVTKATTTKHLATVLPSQTMQPLTYDNLVDLFGSRVSKENIKPFDSFSITYDSIRFSGDRYITNESTYIIPKEEVNKDGKVVIVDKETTFDNHSKKVKDLPIFLQKLDYFVVEKESVIEEGTYELSSSVLENKYDVEISKESSKIKISGRFMAGICENAFNVQVSGDLCLIDGGTTEMNYYSTSDKIYRDNFSSAKYHVTKEYKDGTFELTAVYPILGTATLTFKKK